MISDPNAITITDKARQKVYDLMSDANVKAPDYFLRVGVKGGGCSGLSYELDFDNESRTGDMEFGDETLKIVCDMKSFLYLCGTELDFSDGLNGKGFNFINPNAARTCGCGESFAI
jgi:iron-sulfur cluster assembly protein